jgi:WD40 repeat protein
VAVRPDGRALAVLAVDPHGIYELGTWDVVPDRLPVRTSWRPLEHGTCKTPSAAFAPDGSRFAFTTGRDTVTRLETGHRIVCGEKVIEAEDVNDLRFGPDGRLWAADAHSIRVWTIPGWAEEVPLTNDPATAAGMVFRAVAPGRRLSAVGRRDGRVFLLPAGRPPRPPVAALEAAITAIALTSDEGRVLVGGEGGELAVVGSDGAVGPVLKLHQDRVTSVGVGPGGWVATGSADRTVKLWKVLPATSEGIADLRLVLTLRFDGGVRRVAISDDGQLLTVLVAGERGVRRWRLESLASALADLGISLGRLPAPARTP